MKKSYGKPLLGEILIGEGHVSQENVEEALKLQKKEGGLLGEILIKKGLLTEENLGNALAKQLEFPFLRLSRYHVNRQTVSLLPKEMAEKYKAIAFDHTEGKVSLALSEPLESKEMEEIVKKAGSSCQIFISTLSEIKDEIEKGYPASGELQRKGSR